MMTRFILYIITIISLTFLSSCSSELEPITPLDQTTSKFINSNNEVVFFGKVSFNSVLNKTGYKNKGSLVRDAVNDGVKDINRALVMDNPIYFAAVGPLDKDGQPESIYVFMEAKSDTAIFNVLESEMSYDIEEADDFSYTEDDELCIGIKDRLVIAIFSSNGEPGKKEMKKAFEMTDGKLSGGKVDEILKSTGDIVFGASLESLYASSNTDLENLSKTKQNEIEQMVKDSYLQTNFNFEKGKGTIVTKNLFSNTLKDRMFFNADPKGAIINKVNKGSGKPIMGMSVNLDTKKMEDFINAYSPKTFDLLFAQAGFEKNPLGGVSFLSLITNGQAAGLFTADIKNFTMNANFFINSSQLGSQLGQGYIGNIMDGISFEQDDEGLKGNFSFGSGTSDLSKIIEIPNECKSLGKNGVDFFLYLKDIDVEQLEMFDESKFFTSIEYITFKADNSSSTLVVKTSDTDKNILETALDTAIKELIGNLSGS